MFVGHYAVSFALKKVEKKASLGMLFLAAQLSDILFFPFVLMGIERCNIVENFTASTHFESTYMPYTHSLFASFLWAVGVYIAFKFTLSNETTKKNKIAIIMAAAVLSHWFLDLIVHTPDLPLLSNNSPKLGFGLWNNAIATYILETILLLGGLGLYLKSTKATSFIGKYGMILFVIFMLGLNTNIIFGPPLSTNLSTMSVSVLVLYFFFAGIAFWLDKKRN